MKYRYTISFLILLLTHIAGFSQSQDGSYDQEDLKVLFESLGVNVFKYPFIGENSNSINIRIEEYKNGNLSQAADMFKDFEPMLKMMNKPAAQFFESLEPDKEQWLKVYLHEDGPILKAIVKTSKLEKHYKFNVQGYQVSQAVSFEPENNKLEELMPLFGFFANRDKRPVQLTSDSGPGDYVDQYDYVLLFMAEPLPLDVE